MIAPTKNGFSESSYYILGEICSAQPVHDIIALGEYFAGLPGISTHGAAMAVLTCAGANLSLDVSALRACVAEFLHE
jgi:hypothetical protein